MEYCRTDLFLMGSIVGSIGYMVLHRPVEPAGVIGMWPGGGPSLQPIRVDARERGSLNGCKTI
jgi:hypothetical protein